MRYLEILPSKAEKLQLFLNTTHNLLQSLSQYNVLLPRQYLQYTKQVSLLSYLNSIFQNVFSKDIDLVSSQLKSIQEIQKTIADLKQKNMLPQPTLICLDISKYKEYKESALLVLDQKFKI